MAKSEVVTPRRKPKVPNEYDDPFLFCRSFGHTWRLGEREAEGAVLVRFVLLCNVCKARRIDVINRRNGLAINRRYEYQDGYKATPGEGLKRVSYRVELIRRLDP